MKLALAAAALPALVTGYSMGGFGPFGRPVIITPGMANGCFPKPSRKQLQQQQEWVDRAFSNLEAELNDSAPSKTRRRSDRRRSNRTVDEEKALRQQQEWINRAFGLASEVVSGLAPGDVKESNEALRQQQEWVNRAYGFASDLATGMSSPRYEINDTDEAFQVTMDVPGVLPSDIDISAVEENGQQILTIKGQREMGKDDEVSHQAKFSKSFNIDTSIDADEITAELNNGVLRITAPKEQKQEEESVKKIPVMQVTTEKSSVESKDSSEANEKASPSNDAEEDADEQNGDDDAEDTIEL